VDDAKCIVVTRVRVSVCLSAAVRPHYCTDPDVTWGRGRGCHLVVHNWADLQSGYGLRCYSNITRTLVYAGVRALLISDLRVTEAFSTLLRRPGLQASNGGVLAT